MPPAERVKLRDISHEAGVSIGTVSRVLNSANVTVPISAATRKRVMKAAADLGYRTNLSARAMRTGRYGSVMLLQDMDSSRTLATSECLAGVCDVLDREDIHLVYARVPDSRVVPSAKEPKIFRQAMVDGLILNYHSTLPEGLIERIEKLNLPWVLVNNRRPSDCVYPNELSAGRRATQHLLDLGHTAIAYLDFNYIAEDIPAYHYSRNDRLEGYREAMRDAGLEANLLTADEPIHLLGMKPILDFMRGILRGKRRPTGFVVNNGANELLHVAATESGLSVPGDVSVVTFAHRESTEGLAVSAMRTPWEEIGARSVEMLLARTADPGRSLEPVVLESEFVEGITCGPVAR